MLGETIRLSIADDVVVERIADETALTLCNGDIVVLNGSAGWMVEKFRETEQRMSEVIDGYALRYGIGREQAIHDVSTVVDGLIDLGVLVLRGRSAHICEPQSRRQFLDGFTGYVAEAVSAILGGTHQACVEDASVSRGVLEFRDALGTAIMFSHLAERIIAWGPFAHALVESLDPKLLVGTNARGMHASMRAASKHPSLRMGNLAAVGRHERGVLAATNADMVLDVGTRFSRISRIANAGSNVPVVHLVVPYGTLPEAYLDLYNLTGLERAAELYGLAQAVKEVVDEAASFRGGARRRVYFAQGERGLSTRGRGTLVDDLINAVGAENVAHGLAAVDCESLPLETIAQMEPDIVVLLPNGREDVGFSLSEALSCPVCVVPSEPFSWIDRAPLAMQTVGALWLAQAVYPEAYDSGMEDAIATCLREFFGVSGFEAKRIALQGAYG